MAYISTRGHASPVDLKDLLTRGTAGDGGLYVPEHWPALSADELSALACKPYGIIAAGLLDRFGGEDWISAGFGEGIWQTLDAFSTPDGPPLVGWRYSPHHHPGETAVPAALAPTQRRAGIAS